MALSLTVHHPKFVGPMPWNWKLEAPNFGHQIDHDLDRERDLVLTDIEMPGLDGIELTRRIRACAGWEAVPIVVMTSLGSDEDRRAGLAAGANAYLLKSEFDQADLVDTIRRLTGR